jgi:CheY-like chemotaxis protein
LWVNLGLSNVRLVALTGYGRDEDRARALEAGFDRHLTKPVVDTTLQEVLASLRGEASDPAPTV